MYSTKHLIAIKPIKESYVSITWQVTDFCNFKCSYCNPGNWAGKTARDDGFDLIQQNLSKIVDNYHQRGYKAFKFYFSGGEPTVWPHLIPLIQWLREKIDSPHIGINTNLSRSTAWWRENYHYFHDVVASFHIDFADQQRYMDNLIFLQDKINYLCSRMMMQESRFNEVIEFGKKVRSTLDNFNLEWVPLFDDISPDVGPWKYSEPWMTEFFEKNTFEHQNNRAKGPAPKYMSTSKEVYDSGPDRVLNSNRVVAERRNFFSGWKCHVDESLFINARGEITAASCGQGPRIGNIYGEVNLVSDPVICGKEQCTCGTDIQITKYKQS